MKKRILWIALLAMVLLSIQFPRAAALLTRCSLSVELVNQDPYPANPGEYVKVVFQINGLNNPDCDKVSFELKENFPFSMDPDEVRSYEFSGATYVRNFKSTALAPYKFIVDKDAVDGDNEIEGILRYTTIGGEAISQTEQFNVNVKGVKIDFEVSIRDFDSATNTLTFEILNTGEDNVVALTVDVPKQDSVAVKGSNREIIGDLDANDDTTFKYEAMPKDGEIELAISYTDSINERRSMIKKVYYDSSYFTDRKADEVQPKSIYYYLFYLLLLAVVIVWARGWWKKRKKREKERRESNKR
ncbi:hypothetical protein J4233_00820 [Candidatus Pacearchaeota archaeon]|nr:hypothetical protein [uncultured archaeon]AQS28816.1 hypothetical protein [uncultured archaeon]AQS29003.1 hypothetical protein [uncultured archaeon]MBS3076792.1 hypothetical protein [Candidatus Pacearchaeota archaeon]